MALATSNLSVNTILATLGAASAKAIFYISTTLKTIDQFKTMVNKYGLSATYCPGLTADARLQNLLTDRKLSYFKGYQHFELTITPSTESVPFEGGTHEVTVTANHAWTASESLSWVSISPSSGSSGTTVIEVSVSSNGTGSLRNGTVAIAGTDSGITRNHVVSQSG